MNPSFPVLKEWEWVKVASGVVTGHIDMLDSSIHYYQTYRIADDPAPVNPTPSEPPIKTDLPTEAVLMFQDGNNEPIQAQEAIDVYILIANFDNDTSDTGSIRVNV